MRYTHSLRIIRKRKHTNKISLIITLLLIGMILTLGFTALDAQQFFGGFLQSLTRVVIAYVTALFLSIGIILFITSSKKLEDMSVPVLDVLQSFPSFALFPLLVVWLGKSSIVTILILIVAMIWPILFTILSAEKQLRHDLLEAADVFGAKGFKFLLYVLFPLLFSSIITGSIVAWGEAWETIIAAEIIVSVPGVGTYLAGVGNDNKISLVIIGIFLLLALLFILNKYIWLPLLNMSTKYPEE